MSTAPSMAGIVTRGDLAGNVSSFARHLRAKNRTPATQRTYLDSLDRQARFLDANGMPTDVAAIRREHVTAWLTSFALIVVVSHNADTVERFDTVSKSSHDAGVSRVALA